MAEDMIGRIFNDRYKITERIGSGGMAEVYRAQDVVLGRIVAVKVMLPQYASDPAFTQRFRQEAASAANLSSPYIVNIYDWGQDKGTYYIVMEYVRGSDLKTAIVQRGAINQRKVAEIGSQVCQALTVAHHQDIMHRDIKPQNIMVQPDGNVKVMDFGIARSKNSVMTQTSTVLGTAHYLSPEQAQGKELTAASDIYSLGVVMYEAATGHLPFDGPDAVSVAMKQVNEKPAPPSAIKPDIDPDLEAIILKAMEKNPLDRFATVGEMRTVLNDYLAGRPLSIGFGSAMPYGASGVTRAMNPPYDDGTQVMPVAAAPVVSADPTVARTYNGQGLANNGDKNGKNGKSKRAAIIAVAVVAAIVAIAALAFAFANGGEGNEVPDVQGMSLEEATRTIEDAGFTLGTTSGKFDKSVEEGHVISQDPKPHSKKPEGTKINLVISQGAEEVVVPSFEGLTVEEAQLLADEKGLTLRAGTAKYSSDVDVNHIISQSPKANEKVAKGSTVEYILSLGPENVMIPNVVGKSKDQAISELSAAGFSVDIQDYGYSDTYSAGIVASQNPSSGGKLEKGGYITIYISSGAAPQPTPQPDPQPEPQPDPEDPEQ